VNDPGVEWIVERLAAKEEMRTDVGITLQLSCVRK
jgi:hypothetical protein